MTNLPVLSDDARSLMETDTGEVVELADIDLAALAELRAHAMLAARDAALWKRAVDDELERRHRRTGRAASYTAQGWEFIRKQKRTWDTTLTIEALGELVAEGAVDPEEVDILVPEVTTRKPNGTRLNRLVEDLIAKGKTEEAARLLYARVTSVTFDVQRGIDATVA